MARTRALTDEQLAVLWHGRRVQSPPDTGAALAKRLNLSAGTVSIYVGNRATKADEARQAYERVCAAGGLPAALQIAGAVAPERVQAPKTQGVRKRKSWDRTGVKSQRSTGVRSGTRAARTGEKGGRAPAGSLEAEEQTRAAISARLDALANVGAQPADVARAVRLDVAGGTHPITALIKHGVLKAVARQWWEETGSSEDPDAHALIEQAEALYLSKLEKAAQGNTAGARAALEALTRRRGRLWGKSAEAEDAKSSMHRVPTVEVFQLARRMMGL